MIAPPESVSLREGIVASNDSGLCVLLGDESGDPFRGEELSKRGSESLHGRWVVRTVGGYRCGEAPSKPMIEGSL